jgi:hypothetical protein
MKPAYSIEEVFAEDSLFEADQVFTYESIRGPALLSLPTNKSLQVLKGMTRNRLYRPYASFIVFPNKTPCFTVFG